MYFPRRLYQMCFDGSTDGVDGLQNIARGFWEKYLLPNILSLLIKKKEIAMKSVGNVFQ